MRLDLDASCVQNNPTLSLKATPFFLLPITIKGSKSTIMQTQKLLDLGGFASFIDKELVRQHNLALVGKATLMVIKIIDGQNLLSSPITHETMVLMVTIRSHNSKVVFNVISSPTNPIIIGLSWLILYNFQLD
jgi:hypothetical protein